MRKKSFSSNKPKSFYTRWWYSIHYDGHSHLSRRSVRHKPNWAAEITDLRGCHRHRERQIKVFLHIVCVWKALLTQHVVLLHNEMDDTLGYKYIFNGTASSICVNCAGRFCTRYKREKTHFIRGSGSGSSKEFTCHPKSKLPCVFPPPRYQLQVYFSLSTLSKNKHDLICF